MALCGEGADELFAGYGPLEHSFAQGNVLGRHVQEQCLSMMHRANLQRVDRTGMRFELEIREPFLDTDLVAYAARLDASALLKTVAGLPQGKQPLRALYDLHPELPTVIRDRKKVHFDEGAGIGSERAGWTSLFEEAVSDAEFTDGKKQFAAFELATKEEFFYLRALARHMDVNRVAHLKARTRLLVPEGTKAMPEAMKRITPASGWALPDVVGADLVAVEIADIGEIEPRTAFAGRALVRAAQFQRLGVERVHFVARAEIEGGHGAVAGRGGLLVVRAKHAEEEIAVLAIDAAARGMLEGRFHAMRLEQGVIEFLGLVELVGADRGVTQADHVSSFG